MTNAGVTYQNGLLQLSFQRAMDTGDSNDWQFLDDCYYFLFPVGGGRHSNADFAPHDNTPFYSEEKICIGKMQSV